MNKLYFDIKNFQDARNISDICVKHDIDVDVVCGRYVVDGASLLGVSSMIGRVVEVRPIIPSQEFVDDIKNIGGYEREAE